MWRRTLTVAICSAFAAIACGGESDSEGGKPSGGSGGKGGTSTGGSGGTSAGGSGGTSVGGSPTGGSAGMSSGGGGAGGSGGSVGPLGKCSDAVPSGAVEALDPPAYAGTCPTLVAGANTIQSSGNARAFLLALPSNLQPTEKPPIIFLWHWLGGDASGFLEKGEVQAAVDAQRFIAVIPEKKGDLQFVWPATNLDSQPRQAEEAKFFDDMLSCVSAQFATNKNCVSSAGVSAGALWTDQLAGLRGDYLSSFISLSGGTGGLAIKPWIPPAHKLPGIVLWGGPTDNCANLLSFEQLSHDLEDHLTQDGHFFVECVHNCGHSQPPIDGATSTLEGIWDFVFDHPFWLGKGQSPYLTNGLPSNLPTWCGIGKGGAVPRTGECATGSQC
jgi:hypothetical protein